DALATLFRKTFARALQRTRPTCVANDAAVVASLPAIRTLHDLALAQAVADRSGWLQVLAELAASYEVNPIASGFAAGLRHLAQVASDAEVAALMAQRVS